MKIYGVKIMKKHCVLMSQKSVERGKMKENEKK